MNTDCEHETICMCAGRPECHICGWPFYGCETIAEAEARREEWKAAAHPTHQTSNVKEESKHEPNN